MTHQRGRFCLSWMSLVALALTAPRPAAAGSYTITDLGVISGAPRSSAQAFYAPGPVVASGNLDGSNRALLYTRYHLTEPRTAGGSSSPAGGIHSGQSYVSAVNDSGQVVGWSYPAGSFSPHAFLYSGGNMIDLGTLGGSESYAYGLNALGQVVGQSYTGFVDTSTTPPTVYNGFEHAFLWQNGIMSDLGTLSDGSTSVAYAINGAGEVVGNSYTAGDSAYTPVLWQNGTITDLGSLGGTEGTALGINSSGQVVGWSQNPDWIRHAFLWQDGVITDLNSLIPAGSGWQLLQAKAINDAGQILGSGVRSGQIYQHAFLLTPQ